MRAAVPLLCWLLTAAAGCGSDQRLNPAFPVTAAEARTALRSMRDDPRPLQRPVVVLAGILDPGFASSGIASVLRDVAGDDELVAPVAFFRLDTGTFDGCREHVISSVERAFGAGSGGETVEVDVVAFSMGGLVARHAARPRTDGGTRLKIRRLFTISTPHRGARLAALPTLDARTIDMRSGSAFLADLDAALAGADYELYAYARLGDAIVGEANAAPPGRQPWWVPTPPLSLAHLGAAEDPRILADIARRLRGEPPLTRMPPAPFEAKLPAAPAGGTLARSGPEPDAPR